MKTTMKKILVGLLSTSMLLSLAACGEATTPTEGTADGENVSASTADEPESEESTDDATGLDMNVWIAGTGDGVSDEAYSTIFDAYTAESGNNVEITYISWSEYFTKLTTGILGGTGPDVFMSGYGQFGTLLEGDNLLALDDYIPADWDGLDDIQQNILDIGKSGGSTYGLFMPATRVIYYRKDIAAANGVTEDDLTIDSLADFESLIAKMTVMEGDTTSMYGLSLAYATNAEQQLFVTASMVDPDYALWNDDSTAAFNTDAATTAWDSMVTLYEDGYISLQDAAASDNGLTQGVAAMAIGAEGDYAMLDATFPDQIGIVTNNCSTLLIGDYFCVNPAGEHLEESVDLLLHMWSVESWETHMTVRSAYPARISLQDAYIAQNEEFENVVLASSLANAYCFTPFGGFTEAVTHLRTAIQEPFYGTPSADALATAETAWNGVATQ